MRGAIVGGGIKGVAASKGSDAASFEASKSVSGWVRCVSLQKESTLERARKEGKS